MASDTLLQFPCDFPIKIMGRNQPGFEAHVVELIRPHAPDLDATAVRSRLSQGDNYRAVTVTVHATSQAQLDAIYRALTGDEQVLMVL